MSGCIIIIGLWRVKRKLGLTNVLEGRGKARFPVDKFITDRKQKKYAHVKVKPIHPHRYAQNLKNTKVAVAMEYCNNRVVRIYDRKHSRPPFYYNHPC